MSATNTSFTVITHRVLSKGERPSVGYTTREVRTFDATTTIGEIMTWATGDGVDDRVSIFSGTDKRNGLHLVEIVIPEHPVREDIAF